MGRTWFYGWWLVVVAFLVQMVSTGAVMFSYGVVVVPLADEFGASRMTMMLGMTGMTLVSGIVSPWLGSMVDRRSLRNLMAMGSVSLCLAYLCLSLSTAMWQVPLIYAMFMPLATMLLGPLGATTLLARWFSRKRGMVMGVAAIGTSVGGFLFPPIVQWLIETWEWRIALRLLAGVTLLITLPAILLLVVDRPSDRQLQPDGDDAPAEGAPAMTPGPDFSSSRQILTNRNFWLIAVAISLLFAVYTALLSNLVPFARDVGTSAERSALLLSVMALMGIVGKLVFGVVGDHIDLRLGLSLAVMLVMVGLGCFLAASDYNLLLAGAVAIGLAAGGMLPVWGSLLARIFGAASYGRVMGLMNPVIMPVTLLAPPFAGLMHDVTGSYRVAFAVFAGILVISLILLPLIRVPRRG